MTLIANFNGKVHQQSIQSKLIIALVVLSMLVVLSAVLAWLVFDRINARQNTLLNQSLPTMMFINSAVETGLDLLEVGASIAGAQSPEELKRVEFEANMLFAKASDDIERLNNQSLFPADLQQLNREADVVVNNIRQQLEIKAIALADVLLLRDSADEALSVVERLLIDIKLISSELSLQALSGSSVSPVRLNDLLELRFEVQRLGSIVDSMRYVSSIEQIKKNKNDYRLIINRLSTSLLGFSPESRKVLAVKLALLSDFLSAGDSFFYLAIDQAEKEKELKEIQNDSLETNQNLSNLYRKITEQANVNLDSRARDILEITAFSKVALVATVLASLLVVFLFSIFFIKPKLVNRLANLSRATRSIASSRYEVDIDVDGNDEISAMAVSLAYFRDQLVEKEHVKNRLVNREKTLQAIIDNTVEGLFTVDLKGVIRAFNPACEAFFKASADEVIGRHVDCLLPRDSNIFLSHKTFSAGLDGNGYVVCREKEVLACDNDGENFFGRLSVSMLNLSGHQMYGCFLRDVTAEYEARERIELLVDQLMQSNSDLEQFAYSCSHDLQEPVRMVLSFSELLDNKVGAQLDEDASKYLHYIRQGAKSAKQLIKDMLAYSRLDQTGTLKEWVTLEDLCLQTEEMTLIARQEYGGDLTWDTAGQKLYVVSSQLVQLLTNLVTNGLKYNKSESPLVAITCVEEKDAWLISVKDNGIGIDSRYNKKIFEVFSRLVSKRDYEGSGIGLSICQKIAEKHGGNIWVESELGQGSQFFVRLPKETE